MNKLLSTITILLLAFAWWCSLTIGLSTDEYFHHINGLVRYQFLISLGEIQNFESLRNLKLSDNCIDLNNPRFVSMFESFKMNGCRVDLKNQTLRSYSLEKLVSSLTSFSSSNRDLGRFLQEKGYLRLVDFIQDATIDSKTKDSLYTGWDESFKRGAKMEELAFPDK